MAGAVAMCCRPQGYPSPHLIVPIGYCQTTLKPGGLCQFSRWHKTPRPAPLLGAILSAVHTTEPCKSPSPPPLATATRDRSPPPSPSGHPAAPPALFMILGATVSIIYRVHWRKVSNHERGVSWDEFISKVRKFAPNSLWRHNVTGDLPHLWATSIR